ASRSPVLRLTQGLTVPPPGWGGLMAPGQHVRSWGHDSPHFVQFASVPRGTQLPPQHLWVAVQTVPQAPQAKRSLEKSMLLKQVSWQQGPGGTTTSPLESTNGVPQPGQTPAPRFRFVQSLTHAWPWSQCSLSLHTVPQRGPHWPFSLMPQPPCWSPCPLN